MQNGPNTNVSYSKLALLYLQKDKSPAHLQLFANEYRQIKDNPEQVDLFKKATKLMAAKVMVARSKAKEENELKEELNGCDNELGECDRQLAVLNQQRIELDNNIMDSAREEITEIINSNSPSRIYKRQ